ncbi:lipid A-modifier LpxR family protein [Gemmobacter denitrificans]|uniref:Lipid A-modifier LpxR family protein n=1 Tax=Gemmobacter denitrificans TaxID=3123040 RepID=A0ABU8BUY7_9RHOB
MKTGALAAAITVMAIALALVPGQGAAEGRVNLGFARLFTNDALGDTRDRWRTGAYMVSQFRAPAWHGAAPAQFGELLEYRLRAEIIAPASLTDPTPDRRYAGVIAPGIATHFSLGKAEMRVGAELVFTGPQTKVGSFQREVHELLGLDSPTVLDSQIPNGVHPTLQAEIGRDYQLGDRTRLRPFVEAQAGAEDFLRAGADMVIGRFGAEGLFTRDTVTGQRVLGIVYDEVPGYSLTLGGDVTRMFDSIYLPAGGSAEMSETRTRLRAGVHWQGEKSEAFYGLTWLGEEYEAQPEGQLVGSLRLRLRF